MSKQVIYVKVNTDKKQEEILMYGACAVSKPVDKDKENK